MILRLGTSGFFARADGKTVLAIQKGFYESPAAIITAPVAFNPAWAYYINILIGGM